MALLEEKFDMKETGKTAENPSLCYQCAKCSAGCPVAEDMDMLPHEVMHRLAIGQEDKTLRANTIWMCAGCFTCAVRCPNDIDITTVMDELREKAVAQGIECAKKDVLTFHKSFIRDLSRRGRIHELRLMGEYNLLTGKPLKNAELAPKMLLSGRLKLLPPKAIKGFADWIKKLCKK